jgi:hypothetical protein
MVGVGHYSNFERCLKGWNCFEKAATSTEPHWFKDLLSLWCPSGHASGQFGLRLAIRNGYLNFYRLGQSVARVECVRGQLIAEMHYKYVLDEPPPGLRPKSPNLRLTTEGVFYRRSQVADYEGLSTLHKWISAAEKDHAGAEKTIVDLLVEMNDSVVDLEMAIPAWTLSKVAVRMDLVAIEDGKVVFWEVKTVDDSRIRCRADFEEDKSPHVLEQLSHYRVFLKEDVHIEQVESAYRKAAGFLVKLRALADKNKIGPALKLGYSIVAASQSHGLNVARLANLVVVDMPKPKGNGPSWTSWKASHEIKLKGRIPMLVSETPALLVLAEAL